MTSHTFRAPGGGAGGGAVADMGVGSRSSRTVGRCKVEPGRTGTRRRDCRAPPPVVACRPAALAPPPSIDDTSDLPESAESECWRCWSGSRASGPERASVAASGRRDSRELTDDRPPRARPHPVRRGTDRGQVIDSERKARREAGFNSKKRRAGPGGGERPAESRTQRKSVYSNHRRTRQPRARVPARAILILTALPPPPVDPGLSQVLDCRDKRAGTNSRRSLPRTQT